MVVEESIIIEKVEGQIDSSKQLSKDLQADGSKAIIGHKGTRRDHILIAAEIGPSIKEPKSSTIAIEASTVLVKCKIMNMKDEISCGRRRCGLNSYGVKERHLAFAKK